MKRYLLSVFCLVISFIGYGQPGFSCAEAIVIGSLPYSTTDNTSNYGNSVTGSPGNSCGANTSGYLHANDVIYSYTPTTSGYIKVTMTPSVEKTGIFVYDGCGNVGLSCVAAAARPDATPRIIPQLEVIAGQTYVFVISKDLTIHPTFDYTFEIENLNCYYPTQLSVSNVTPTTATLSWNNPADADEFEVLIQPVSAGNTPTGSGTLVSFNPYMAINLDSGTEYFYWVRSVCGDGSYSLWSPRGFFQTTIVNTTCDEEEQCNYIFELQDAFGDSWNGNSVTVRQNGADISTMTISSSNNSYILQYPVPLCNDEPFELFWNEGGDFPGEVMVKVYNPFEQLIYVKPAGTGEQGTLLFASQANCDSEICVPPVFLQLSQYTGFSATLSWTELDTATEWEVFVVPAGSPPPGPAEAGIPTAANPFVVTGLDPEVDYDFYVRAVCAEGWMSDWSMPRPLDNNLEVPVTDARQMSVYPNPASASLNILAGQPIDSIALYDLMGKRVMSRSVRSESAQLDVSPLASGIYILEIQTESLTQRRKIVIE